MGRKSKLTDGQWEEIRRRLLEGEAGRKLAGEFGVSEAAIRKHIGSQVNDIKTVANQLASANSALAKLPFGAQISARTLAQRLESLSVHTASAAESGAMIADRLMGIARMKVEEIDDAQIFKPESIEALKSVTVLTRMANESGVLATNILKANREVVADLNRGSDPAGDVTTVELVPMNDGSAD